MMRKLLNYSLLPAVALLLFSCGKGEPSAMTDINQANAADSMMYYLGEMQASTYWQDAETDTLLATQEARDQFVKGVRDAIEMGTENAAYNRGLQLGLRLSLRLEEFKGRYGLTFPASVLVGALKANLEKDNRQGVVDAQKGFYKIKDRLELEAAGRELQGSKILLQKKGEEMGFKMINDTLYAKPATPATNGPLFKVGERLAVDVSASTLEGREIVARQFPDSITIGEGRVPNVVREGILTMTSGQTRTFMTTPRTLFGKRYKAYNLPSDEPVIFTVKAYN